MDFLEGEILEPFALPHWKVHPTSDERLENRILRAAVGAPLDHRESGSWVSIEEPATIVPPIMQTRYQRHYSILIVPYGAPEGQ
jgi:hypothetical protein